MKKLNILAISALILFAAACTKENREQITPTDNPQAMTLTVSTEGSTKTYLDGLNVKFHENDHLMVLARPGLGTDLYRIKFTTTADDISPDGSTAKFSSTEWPAGIDPEYATNSFASTSCLITSGGKVRTMITENQQISRFNSCGDRAGCSVGKISKNAGQYTVETLKNLGSLIKFRFTGDNKIKQIEVEAIGGEYVAGMIDVDMNTYTNASGFWTASTGKLTTTLTPAGEVKDSDNSFKAKDASENTAYYYVNLLPQTYSQGLKFTLTKTDDEKIIKVVGATPAGLTLERGKSRELGLPIDQLVPMPATLTFHFGGSDELWVFKETASSTTTNYTYPYYNSTGYYQDYIFNFSNISSRGASTDGIMAIKVAKSAGVLTLPVIEGRCFKSISGKIVNANTKKFNLFNGDTQVGTEQSCTYPSTPSFSFVRNDSDGITPASVITLTYSAITHFEDITVVYDTP